MIQSQLKPAELSPQVIDANVVALNNYIGPHHQKQLEACAKRVREFRLLLSTEMEPNRGWDPEWGGLNVEVQKNLMLRRKWRHKGQFVDEIYVHIPWDTIPRLRKINPDVILSYELGARTLLSTFYRARHPNCALVVIANISEYTEQSRGRLRQILRRHLMPKIDLITYNGPSCKRYLLNLGFRNEQLFHFPYCHDQEKVFCGERRFTGLPHKLFYAGSISERKGIVPFCQALARWCEANPDRQIEFTIYGDGPLRLVVETKRRPANLQIAQLRSASASEIRQRYGASDVTIYPSLADEWGMVVNESLGSGTPILATKQTQAAEVLCQDGINSWIFDAEDPIGLDEALDRALATPADRLAEMSERARESVSHINPEYSADLFAELIRAAQKVQRRRSERT